MFRPTDLVMITLMVAGAAFTYKTKHDTEAQLTELRRVEQQIQLEQDSITVLKADWSLLTQPSHLQRLYEAFADELELEIVQPHQIVGFEDLPVRPLEIEDILNTADIPADDITTGAIGQ
jgi:hypothetical protein